MALKFAIFGHPVGHSLSPVMHAANFAALGIDASYGRFDVPPEALREELARCAGEGYSGLNVTMPHKKAIMPLLDSLAQSAIDAGAVNTVKFLPGGKTEGHNTDVGGFFADLAERGVDIAGKKVAIAGCGGAGAALAAGFARLPARSLHILNRTPAKAVALAERLAAGSSAGAVVGCAFALSSPEAESVFRDADIIVNATSAGLKQDDAPAIPPAAMHSGQTVCDIVPVARETATVRAARSAGAVAIGGLGMLLRQAVLAFRIWTGLEPDVEAMRKALDSAMASGGK